MHLSVRAKVFLTVALSLVVIFAVTMLIIVVNERKELQSSLNQESKSFAALATTPIGNTFLIYQDSGTVKINQQVGNYLELDPDVTSVSVINTNGNILYSSGSSTNLNISSNDASSFSPLYKNSSGYTNEIIYPFIESTGVHSYAVVYKFSTQRVQQNVTDVIRLILAIGITVMVISIVGTAFMFNRLFIKPIRLLSQSAYVISNGNYDQQIVSSQQDEIGSLAKALNKMASSLKEDIIKLKDLDKMKSEFMIITSHNLRTPISIIEGYLSMLQEEDLSDDTKANIKPIDVNIKRLKGIAEDILTISKIEAGEDLINLEAVEIDPLLESIAKDFASIVEDKHLKFTTDIKTGAKVNIASPYLRSAAWNLLDNAHKFTNDGGSIQLIARKTETELLISIKDTGVGIAKEELANIFVKFHHATDSMTSNFDSLGIGLYASKLMLQEQNATIEVESELGTGSTFTIRLPLAN